MTSMQIMYDELRRYGDIISDKNHETTEGHFIRFTTYEFEDRYYVVTMFDGIVLMVVEKDDVRELIKKDAFDIISEEEIERITSDGYNPHL